MNSKFDEMINYIAENSVPIATEMARPKNPEFQKWKEENPGVPVYKFFKAQRDRKAASQSGGVPASVPPSLPGAPVHSPDEPVNPMPADDAALNAAVADTPPTEVTGGEGHFKELPDTLRTKEAVAEFLQVNPGAGEQEVMDALVQRNNEETPLNLDPEVVKSAIAEIQNTSGAGEVEQEPDLNAIKKADLASKYERMRQALYKARGFKTKEPGEFSVADTEDEENIEDEEETPVDMRDEPIDPNEL